MKARTQLPILLVAALAAGLLSSTAARPSSAAQEDAGKTKGKLVQALAATTALGSFTIKAPTGMEQLAENGTLSLFFNTTTTEIAVGDKRSGALWFSNPQGRDNAAGTEAFTKGLLGSQLNIHYYSENGDIGSIDNYNESIAKKQFDYTVKDGVLAVNYAIGDQSSALAAPQRFSKKRFEEEILPKITDAQKREDMKNAYRYVPEAGYYEQWSNLLSGKKKTLLQTLVEIGYKEEDFRKDNAQNGVLIKPKVNFAASLEYRLDGDQLVVRVPMEKLAQSSGSFPIRTVSVLENFGAADSSVRGYMLIPDGSGALVRLNNHKTSAAPISIPVYGNDQSIDDQKRGAVTETARLPVFGMNQGDQGFFAIIENGDAIANIEADVGGRQHPYNEVYASFTTNAMDKITLNGGGVINSVSVFQPKMYDGDAVIRYSFLSGQDATYSGMASYYRSYLVDHEGLKPLEKTDSTPFFVELLGAIRKKTSFLGVPYRKTVALTTFDQTRDIVLELKQAGVTNLKLRYLGWMNGGLQQKLPTGVDPVGALGGASGLRSLADFLKKEQVGFYPDVSMLTAYDSGFRIGMNPNAARFINQQTAVRFPFHLTGGFQDKGNATSYFIVSPSKLPRVADRFAGAYEALHIPGLSAGDLGEWINSDFSAKGMADREKASDVIRSETEKLAKQFPDLLVSGGNVSVVPFFKSAVHVPMTSSQYQLADESVPFYQMVMHGFVDYAGEPANLYMDGDLQDYKLKLLETGSDVYFQWSYAPSSVVKDTEFAANYASDYRDWLQDAVSLQKEAAKVLSGVRQLPITSHAKLAEGVYQTVYGGSYTVTVNYNEQPLTVNGAVIPAKGYQTGGVSP